MTPGLQYCETRDLDSWRVYLQALRARLRFECGDWEGASVDAADVLRDPDAAVISRLPALIVLGHLRVRRGDPDFESPLAEARSLAMHVEEVQRLAPLALACAEAAALAGDSTTQCLALRTVWTLAAERGDSWTRGLLALELWRLGTRLPGFERIAAPCAQEMAGDWRTASSDWERLGCAFEQARVLALHGDESDKCRAVQIFDELGAAPAARALRQQLRSDGVRRIPRGQRPSTREDPQGLTRREVQVLALLADSLSNSAIATRLFLSIKTVDHHVAAVLAKLGVASRAEAAAMARHRAAGIDQAR